MKTRRVAQITAVLRITPGRRDSLREELAALHGGSSSPFESVHGTHFARFVVVDHLGSRAGTDLRIELDPPRLLFSVDCDGEPRGYLLAMCEALGDLTGKIFGNCEDYPGSDDPARFAEWVWSHQLRPTLPFSGVDAAADVIKEGLALRRRMITFAVAAQGLEPSSLREQWRQEFGW